MISKLFLRLYIVVVITLVGVGWSLDKAFDILSTSPEEPDTYGALFQLINEQLGQLDERQWPIKINQLKKRLDVPITVESIQSFTANDGEVEGLEEGEIITFYDETGETLIQRIQQSAYVLSMGPVGDTTKSLKLEFTLAAIFYISLAAAILMWLWPIWKNLHHLSAATMKFGRGKFDARAIVPENSPVSPLATTFNAMASRIQRLIDSHKELTNAVSHDLRTPLARMRFGIDMLEDGDDAEAKQRYIESMRADIDELDTLIHEMLTYATFDRDAPDLTMDSTAIGPWIKKIVQDASATSQRIKIDYSNSDESQDQIVQMEPRYMSRALSNLISNAVRYAKNRIDVSVSNSEDTVAIHVDDDGPGVPAKDRKKIFEAFKKQDNVRDSKSGGFGLGLAIVHRIVQWHGGQVSVTDSPLGGARFHIDLPMVKPKT